MRVAHGGQIDFQGSTYVPRIKNARRSTCGAVAVEPRDHGSPHPIEDCGHPGLTAGEATTWACRRSDPASPAYSPGNWKHRQKTPQLLRRFPVIRSLAGSRGLGERDDLLWEEDLDATVLRLAHTGCGWHARIVHAATGHDHIAARHALGRQSVGDGIGTPLRKSLIVAGRAREIGIACDLQPDRATRLVLLRSEQDDLLALRRDVILIPVEEH